jgi:hypothetical protein
LFVFEVVLFKYHTRQGKINTRQTKTGRGNFNFNFNFGRQAGEMDGIHDDHSQEKMHSREETEC